MPRLALTLAAALVTAALPIPQQHEHSPYAGQESSEIPSLTEDEVAQLRGGEGMGLAKAAELNGYPGPKHVLELDGELKLNEQQRVEITTIFDAMHAEAVQLGEQIIEGERGLNMRFQHGHADATWLDEAVTEIAALRGQLRAVHLGAHLTTTAALTEEQVAQYQELRGYAH